MTDDELRVAQSIIDKPLIAIPNANYPDNYALREHISIRTAIQLLIDQADVMLEPVRPARFVKRERKSA